MREPEMYRLVLESLLKETHGQRVLRQADVARLLNKSRGWVSNKLGVKRDGITVEGLAWKLASL